MAKISYDRGSTLDQSLIYNRMFKSIRLR